MPAFYATAAIFAALWTFTAIPPFTRLHVLQERDGCRGRCIGLAFYLCLSAADALAGAGGWRLAAYWVALAFVLGGNGEQTRRIVTRRS